MLKHSRHKLFVEVVWVFSVWLLSVLRGHSFFSSPPQRPMTSDFEGFLSHILFITLFSYLNSWERASISLLMFSAKQGNYLVPFYNVFGMTRSSRIRCQHSTTRISRRRWRSLLTFGSVRLTLISCMQLT